MNAHNLRHKEPPQRISGVRSLDHSLEFRPVIRLLIDALEHRFSGTLQLNDELGRRHDVLFERGVPCQVSTPIKIEPFDQTLARLGLGGNVIDQQALDGVMRVRVMMLVEQLYELSDETRVHFFPNLDLVAERQRAPCNALALIMIGLRREASSPEAQRTLDELGQCALRLHPDAEPRLIGATPIETKVIAELERRPTTLAALCARNIGPITVVRATIYALTVLRFLQRERIAPPLSLPKGYTWPVPPKAPPASGQQSALTAALARAETHFRRRHFEQAEGLLLKVLALEPDDHRAKSLLAWLRAERQGRPTQLLAGDVTRAYEPSLAMLDQVVRDAPHDERARYWRAKLLERSGYVVEAVEDFRAVLAMNPRNIGAERGIKRYEQHLAFAGWIRRVGPAHRVRRRTPISSR